MRNRFALGSHTSDVSRGSFSPERALRDGPREGEIETAARRCLPIHQSKGRFAIETRQRISLVGHGPRSALDRVHQIDFPRVPDGPFRRGRSQDTGDPLPSPICRSQDVQLKAVRRPRCGSGTQRMAKGACVRPRPSCSRSKFHRDRWRAPANYARHTPREREAGQARNADCDRGEQRSNGPSRLHVH
jgi:hypothetical protein